MLYLLIVGDILRSFLISFMSTLCQLYINFMSTLYVRVHLPRVHEKVAVDEAAVRGAQRRGAVAQTRRQTRALANGAEPMISSRKMLKTVEIKRKKQLTNTWRNSWFQDQTSTEQRLKFAKLDRRGHNKLGND